MRSEEILLLVLRVDELIISILGAGFAPWRNQSHQNEISCEHRRLEECAKERFVKVLILIQELQSQGNGLVINHVTEYGRFTFVSSLEQTQMMSTSSSSTIPRLSFCDLFSISFSADTLLYVCDNLLSFVDSMLVCHLLLSTK